MKILVIGGGGREHTLAWKLAQSPKATKLYAIPGNPGMAEIAECVPDISIEDNKAVVDFAKTHDIDLAVVGPEVPLTNGIVDAFEAAGILAFGPRKLAAEIEGSKSFSKGLMKKYGIPTAKYEVFTDAAAAKDYIRKEGAPIVIKADGLAAGKGVVVAMTEEEALRAITDIMEAQEFGQAGSRVVIEEFMEGEEASLLAFTDGETIVPMISSQDHKRAYDGDKGPNTGGMGTYAPAPVMTPALVAQAKETILEPAIRAMAVEGRKYQGCLYAGLMITADGPKVVEFNCRFGDPETQAVLPLLDGDLAQIMYACAKGTLTADMVHWKDAAACCVIMASAGYPASSHKGDVISGLDAVDKEDVMVFHSGTAKKDDQYVTNGGRVLGVTAIAPDLKSAIEKAYDNVKRIHFDGQQVRSDIGAKGLKHLK